MIIPVSVKNQSIDSSGITSDYKAAISEYIWNGFEANAKKVSIEYTLNEAFGVKELIIKDNKLEYLVWFIQKFYKDLIGNIL